MKTNGLFSAALACTLAFAGVDARADYVVGIAWGGSWVVDPGYPTENPPNGGIGGSLLVRTPSAAGTYSFSFTSGFQISDIEVSVTLKPDDVPSDGAQVLWYSGSFSEDLWGEYPSKWAFSGTGASGYYGDLVATEIDAQYGGVGYGSSGVDYLAYEVPEPPAIVTTAAGLVFLGLGLRRRKALLGQLLHV